MTDDYEKVSDDTVNPVKKYELTEDACVVEKRTLYRIRALRSFGDVKAGDLGGFVESDDSLSHLDECWVANNAKVLYGGFVTGNAQVSGEAEVGYGAIVQDRAVVTDNAKVCGAVISGMAKVYGNAVIDGECSIRDYAEVYGYAEIYDACNVEDHAKVCGDASLSNAVSLSDNVRVYGNAVLDGDINIMGEVQVCGDAKIQSEDDGDDVVLSGNRIIAGEGWDTYSMNIMCEGISVCVASNRSIAINGQVYSMEALEKEKGSFGELTSQLIDTCITYIKNHR